MKMPLLLIKGCACYLLTLQLNNFDFSVWLQHCSSDRDQLVISDRTASDPYHGTWPLQVRHGRLHHTRFLNNGW